MLIWKFCLLASWILILFNYGGYAIIALILNKLFPYKPKNSNELNYSLPRLSFIVAAYNEAGCISAKIENCLDLDYPKDRVEWLFVTDGSTDTTPGVVGNFPGVHLLHRPERLGKSAALNRAVAEAAGEIIIASDANTILNKDALQLIAAHYRDPEVGGVAGEKKVERVGSVGGGEGLYWKYESALKRIDGSFYSVVGAAGELFSFRKELYEPVAREIILDDFVISMRIAARGYRIAYEPGACARETPSFSIAEESKRKIRIAAGGFQAVRLLGPALHWKANPRLTYLYISHRVLRWIASPFCLVLSFLAGTILAIADLNPLYKWLWATQTLFFGLGILSPFLPGRKPFTLARLPHYFLFMNLSVLQGFGRWLRGNQPGAWEKVKRA